MDYCRYCALLIIISSFFTLQYSFYLLDSWLLHTLRLRDSGPKTSLISTFWQCCLGKAKPKNVFISIINLSINVINIFCTAWTDLLTHCLLVCVLMPSNEHNLRTARAMDLIFHFIVTLSQDVPFYLPQQLHHGVTFEPFCAPILSSQPWFMVGM